MLPLAQAPAHPYGSPFLRCHPSPPPLPLLFFFCGWRAPTSLTADVSGAYPPLSVLSPLSSLPPCCSFAVWICCASILVPPYSSLAACAGALCSSIDSPSFPCLCLLLSLHTDKGSPREHDAMGGRQLEIASWSPAGFNAGSKCVYR